MMTVDRQRHVANVLLAVCASWASSAAAAGPPSVLLILADDLGHADLGYSSDDVSTPAIDALAATGLKLSCMYTWNWCAPSRGALMVRLITR